MNVHYEPALRSVLLDIGLCCKTTYRRQKLNKNVEEIPKPKSFSRFLKHALKVRAISYPDHVFPEICCLILLALKTFCQKYFVPLLGFVLVPEFLELILFKESLVLRLNWTVFPLSVYQRTAACDLWMVVGSSFFVGTWLLVAAKTIQQFSEHSWACYRTRA